MNLSISNASTVSRKHLKVTYLAAACAIALAAGAVVCNVTWQHRSSAQAGIVASSSTASATQTQQNPSYVYYLVRTQQEAADLTSVLSSEGAAYGTPANKTVLVDGPESRNLVSSANAELTNFRGDVRIVEPTTPVAAISKTVVTSPSDAAILAGVISSERATWAFPAAAVAETGR